MFVSLVASRSSRQGGAASRYDGDDADGTDHDDDDGTDDTTGRRDTIDARRDAIETL